MAQVNQCNKRRQLGCLENIVTSLLNGSLSNISGTATPYGVFTTQDIKYIRFGRIVIVTGWVNVGAVQPSGGYPIGGHHAVATIPFTPYGKYSALSVFCSNAAAAAEVLVEPGIITFKTTNDPYPDVIYISGAFII